MQFVDEKSVNDMHYLMGVLNFLSVLSAVLKITWRMKMSTILSAGLKTHRLLQSEEK